MRFYSMTTNRAAIDSLSFHDAVTIGGGIHEIRLRFGKAAPAFWKIWKAVETGTQEDQKAAYNSLSALLFGEDAAGIAAAEGEAVFFVWLYHYTKTRVLPFMLACSAALKFAYMRASVYTRPPMIRAFYSVYLRLRMAAEIAKARKYQ